MSKYRKRNSSKFAHLFVESICFDILYCSWRGTSLVELIIKQQMWDSFGLSLSLKQTTLTIWFKLNLFDAQLQHQLHEIQYICLSTQPAKHNFCPQRDSSWSKRVVNCDMLVSFATLAANTQEQSFPNSTHRSVMQIINSRQHLYNFVCIFKTCSALSLILTQSFTAYFPTISN